MGEYAIRKADGAQIKIGTCEMMYYLRFEDRHKVRALVPNNVDPVRDAPELKFRLPYPDEDAVLPGDYKDYTRGYRLWKKTGAPPHDYCQDFEDPDTVEDPGIIQLTHKSGLLLNVPCYHGHKLPDVAAPMTAFWNGKSWSLELAWLRPVRVEGKVCVFPVVQCRHCGHLWRYTWDDIWEYIADEKLRNRLQVYRGHSIEL